MLEAAVVQLGDEQNTARRQPVLDKNLRPDASKAAAVPGLLCPVVKADRVARLIAGPKVFICSSCVTVAEGTLDGPTLTGEETQDTRRWP